MAGDVVFLRFPAVTQNMRFKRLELLERKNLNHVRSLRSSSVQAVMVLDKTTCVVLTRQRFEVLPADSTSVCL